MSKRKSKAKIYLRADGNNAVGFGHVMRLLALAEILYKDFQCFFVIASDTPFLQNEIFRLGLAVLRIPQNTPVDDEPEFIHNHVSSEDSIIVLDGYSFNQQYQECLKEKGHTVVFIDDLHAFFQVSDVVINHAEGVDPNDYSVAPYTKLFCGAKYAILRKPFMEAAGKARDLIDLNSLFISFGGADVLNFTCMAIEAALEAKNVRKINVVISSSFSHRKQLGDLLQKNENIVKVYSDLKASQMEELMSTSGMAIAPSSTISYELCSVGVGLISGYYVENQRNIYNGLKAKNCIIPAQNFSKLPREKWIELIEETDGQKAKSVIAAQKEVFDGKSADNLLKIFNDL